MTEKIKQYLDGLFENVPQTQEVQDAKEELYNSMIERYADCLKTGMDEQEAYDNVVDSLGDIHELFAELDRDSTSSTANTSEKSQGHSQSNSGNSQFNFNPQIDLTGFVKSIGNFTSRLVNGLLGGGEYNGLPLVNKQTISLESISSIDIGYVSENVTLCYAEDENITICEYMSKDEPSLYADIQKNGAELLIKSGRRTGMIFLHSYIIVHLPASWNGSLAVSTVSGSVKSGADWTFSTFNAKSTSGKIQLHSVIASLIRLSSTSGSVTIDKAVGYIEASSGSGSVKVECADGGGVFKTVSGGVRVNFENLRGHVTATTTTGGIRLGLPANASFELNAKCTTGAIHTGFDSSLIYNNRNKAKGFIGQAPFYNVTANTTTGSIHIND